MTLAIVLLLAVLALFGAGFYHEGSRLAAGGLDERERDQAAIRAGAYAVGIGGVGVVAVVLALALK